MLTQREPFIALWTPSRAGGRGGGGGGGGGCLDFCVEKERERFKLCVRSTPRRGLDTSDSPSSMKRQRELRVLSVVQLAIDSPGLPQWQGGGGGGGGT